jgi:hypothetical protein
MKEDSPSTPGSELVDPAESEAELAPRFLQTPRAAYRLRIHVRSVTVVGFAGVLLLLFASPTTPWLQLVFSFWVLLVSINILVLAYRSKESECHGMTSVLPEPQPARR